MTRVGGAVVRFIGRSSADVSPKRVGGTSVVVAGIEQLHPTVRLHLEPQGTANATRTTVIGVAPFAGVVSSVSFVAAAAITGDDTDNRKFAVVNKGQAGAGTTEVAGVTFETDVDAAAAVAMAVPVADDAGDLVVAAGDVLTLVETISGTGLAHGGGLVSVTFDAA